MPECFIVWDCGRVNSTLTGGSKFTIPINAQLLSTCSSATEDGDGGVRGPRMIGGLGGGGGGGSSKGVVGRVERKGDVMGLNISFLRPTDESSSK